MLNITEIKTNINKAIERFQKVFTDFEPPKIVAVIVYGHYIRTKICLFDNHI